MVEAGGGGAGMSGKTKNRKRKKKESTPVTRPSVTRDPKYRNFDIIHDERCALKIEYDSFSPPPPPPPLPTPNTHPPKKKAYCLLPKQDGEQV